MIESNEPCILPEKLVVNLCSHKALREQRGRWREHEVSVIVHIVYKLMERNNEIDLHNKYCSLWSLEEKMKLV